MKCKVISLIMAAVVMLAMFVLPQSVNAADSENAGAIEITAFRDVLPAETYPVGTQESELKLPDTLTVEVNDSGVREDKKISGFKWKSDGYDPGHTGTYVFDLVLPEGYTTSAETPELTVKLEKTAAEVTGVPDAVRKKAGRSIVMHIGTSAKSSRKMYLQQYSGGTWVTRTEAAIDGTAALTLPASWYSRINTVWRIYMPETEMYEAYTKTFTVKAVRVFQNNKKYFQIKDYIGTRKTTYLLKTGMSGYKVYKAEKKLNCYGGHAKYTSATAGAVKSFQRKHGLPVTGKIDLATWEKLGFSKHSWYYMDSYVYPIQVTPASTKKQCINAMINAALKYKGTRYIWCASAKPHQGVDCAGLVIQALYAAGIDPLPSGSHVYAYAKNEYTTSRMWNNKKFKHVSFYKKKRGDIICYYGHVAIYMGHGEMIEALPGGVRISGVRGSARGVLRPFA